MILLTVVEVEPVSSSNREVSGAKKRRDPREVVPAPPDVRKLSRIVHVNLPDWGSKGGDVKPSSPPMEESREVEPKSAWMNTVEGIPKGEDRLKKRRSQVTVCYES